MRASAELETYVVSVERVDEYLNIDSEVKLITLFQKHKFKFT